jgi:hypothetical protein
MGRTTRQKRSRGCKLGEYIADTAGLGIHSERSACFDARADENDSAVFANLRCGARRHAALRANAELAIRETISRADGERDTGSRRR